MRRRKKSVCPGYFSYPPCYGTGCVRPNHHPGQCIYRVPGVIYDALYYARRKGYKLNSSPYVTYIAKRESILRDQPAKWLVGIKDLL